MRPPHVFWPLFCLVACSGPDAPDAAVCRDVITRLCQAATCPGVAGRLPADEACEPALLARTGCGAEDFTFSEPSRQRVLECREPLLSQSTSTAIPPRCEDAARLLTECPAVADFFLGGGGQP